MDTNPETVELALEQALEWLERLKAPQPGEQAGFMRWLTSSPVHVREMLIAAECDRALRGIDAAHSIDVAALLATGLCNVVPLRGEVLNTKADAPSAGRAPRALKLAFSAWHARSWKVAASLAVIALGAWSAWAIESRSSEREIITDRGEWKTQLLADGTTLRIAPQTHLTITLAKDERRVDLVMGEADFEVARDATRPFRVRTATAEAQALGTRFAVRSREDVVSISVSEGLVAVERIARAMDALPLRTVQDARESVRVGAGEQVTVTAHAPLSVEAHDATLRIDWTRGVFIAQGARLRTLIDQLNERNEPQIYLTDVSLNARRIFGAFPLSDPLGFVQFLRRSDLRAVELRERQTAATAPASPGPRDAAPAIDVN